MAAATKRASNGPEVSLYFGRLTSEMQNGSISFTLIEPFCPYELRKLPLTSPSEY